MKDSLIFSPLSVRGLKFRNRIVLSPMLTYSAKGGHISDWHVMHYGKFAAGGAGLVFVESTKVDPRGCSTAKDTGMWKDDFIEPMRRIVAIVKGNGAVAGIQLSHSGRKARQSLPWEGRSPMEMCPGVDHGEAWELIGPSAVSHGEKYATPRAMTIPDIAEAIEAWGKAAERADRAGFDVVEIHGAHGYLIHQFLSSVSNQRSDEYGGSFEHRARFALEVARRVRQSWPEGKPLFFRISSVDDAGWKVEHSIRLAKLLKAEGVDVIDCSAGGMTGLASVDVAVPYGYQVEYAEKIRAGADIRTMAVGMIIHADQAEEILRNESADFVALGREFLHNPNWALDAAQKLGIESAFSHVPKAYGYWLEKRSRIFKGKPSTWQNGIGGR